MATPTIQTLRHMKNVGIFADVAVGAFPYEFKPYNLIYGFNGCGKTTLSRLIECLGQDGLSDNLADGAEFSFSLSDGSKPSHDSLANAASRHLAVFNEDYIDRTLTWKEGTAKPIIYLGKEQAEIAKQLSDLEAKEALAAPEEVLRSSEWSSAYRALETKGRDTARLIAEELNLGRRYTAANLKSDYEAASYGPSEKISAEERKQLKEIINRSDLPSHLAKETALTGGHSTKACVDNALQTKVDEIAIAALQRRKDALGWVETGLHLHTTEKDCLFCGNKLSESRIQELKLVLKAGFDTFSAQLTGAQLEVETFRDLCVRHKERLGSSAEVLPSHKTKISDLKKPLVAALETVLSVADEWLEALAKKRANPDQAMPARELSDVNWDEVIAAKYDALSQAIDENNSAIDNFAAEQQSARELLKRHFLADHETSYDAALALETKTNDAKAKATAKLGDIRAEVTKLRGELRTHGPAAAELNRLLKSYLGHSHITLEAVEEGYRICRQGRVSRKPLSEGEKTAVAFCYFITSLSSEGRRIADLIVVLDDPISSLDARAMTHVVAMIRKRFSSPTQLFILTHNLDFMREMKKWLFNKYKKELAEFLFIEIGIDKFGTRTSQIVKLPKLIRDYDSEYHYLYSLVKFLADKPDEAERFAYLMPNAIRKVLDIFLAFKEPGASGLEPKVAYMSLT